MLGIAASFAGGLLNTIGQNKANKRNVASQEQINRDNNLASRRLNMANIAEARRAEGVGIAQTLAAEARADARLLKNQEYASPAAERARLEAAGMNPAAFLQNNAPAQGSAIAASSGPLPRLSMATAHAATVQAATGLGASISEVGQLISDRETLIMQNDWLNKRLEKQTVQPRVGGVYEGKSRGHISKVASSDVYSGRAGANGIDRLPAYPVTHKVVTGDEERLPPATFMGVKMSPSRWFSDAETLEGRYGDIVSMITGLGILGGDAVNTISVRGSANAKRERARVKKIDDRRKSIKYSGRDNKSPRRYYGPAGSRTGF